jgi:hypothetical protein
MLPDNWRELSYRKLDLDDHTLDKNLPEYETPLQRKPAKRNAGVLETLPLELLQLILARAIARYGQNALRGSLAINTAANIYVEKLHQQLFKKSCENCGAFAPYLYLITCARVCFLCLSEADQYCPLEFNLIKRKYGLDSKVIQPMPQMRCLPGVYSPSGRKIRIASALYDAGSALRAAVTYHGSSDNVKTYIENVRSESMALYDRKTREATKPSSRLSRVLSRLQESARLIPFDRKSSNRFRFVAVVELPVINKSSKAVDWGFYCKACRNANKLPRHWRVRYDEETFEQHILACGSIEHGIHQAPVSLSGTT